MKWKRPYTSGSRNLDRSSASWLVHAKPAKILANLQRFLQHKAQGLPEMFKSFTRVHCYSRISFPLLTLQIDHRLRHRSTLVLLLRVLLQPENSCIPSSYCNELASNKNSTISVPFIRLLWHRPNNMRQLRRDHRLPNWEERSIFTELHTWVGSHEDLITKLDYRKTPKQKIHPNQKSSKTSTLPNA